MKPLWISLCAAMLLSCVLSDSSGAADEPQDPARSRAFRFNYSATINELPDTGQIRVWFPVPRSNDDQRVTLLYRHLPVTCQMAEDPIYGNQIAYFEITSPPAGSLTFTNAYLIRRAEVRGLACDDAEFELSKEERALFLSANAKVPLEGKQLRLLDGLNLSGDTLATARRLYDQVDAHVRYDKSLPGYGNGDVLWVCDSRFGNCTDFHSLFISLCRGQGVPARFEIGFPVPQEVGSGAIGGYHCWASFFSDACGWVPVDISEADKHPPQREYFFGNLTADRVSLTIGRDINLVPRQASAPLNFFIYPHVEVDGKPWASENIDLSFTYADVERANQAED